MILAAMQPYFLPYIGYFQLIASADVFVPYDHLPFIRRGWANRNRVLHPHRGPTYLTVPTTRTSVGTLSSVVRIDDRRDWRGDMLALITESYRRAACFEELYPFVQDLLGGDEVHLSELSIASLRRIAALLELGTTIVVEDPEFAAIEDRLRERAASPTSSSSSASAEPEPEAGTHRRHQRVIELCRVFGADAYHNAIGGRAIYDGEVFARHGVALRFVETLAHTYPQGTEPFSPNLSILDVLFNCGIERTRELIMGTYRLVP
jgi:hypothetical protein